MIGNSASYYNNKSDLYKVIKNALHSNDSRLDEISNLLSEIRDLLVEMKDNKGE